MIRTTQTAIALASIVLAGPVAAATEGSSSASAGNSASVQATAGIDNLCKSGFASSDSNSDGTVSRDELNTAREQMFGALDSDGDGELSRAEYVDCMNQSARSAVGDTAAKSGGKNTDLPDLATADRDGSGTVDTDEYMSATHDAQQQASAGTDDGAVLLLRRYIVAPVGYTDADVRDMGEEETAARAARQFQRFDADRSGDISEREWSEASTMQNDISDVLNMEYDRLDADASGTVNRQEFSDAGTNDWDAAREAIRNATRQSGTTSSAQETSGTSTRTSEADNQTEGNRGTAGSRTPPVVYYRYFAPLEAG
ncbi:hypothetical protein OB2597_10791 [Pseudooceanicola batsensis HTCC2597]|uniref:EF-hand domain-containing protein n=1 Tax=Pseudooceanicola batsensis (strain ATCC BAA-863 / DSM 15984 / KCTC 12145 / HTCC2597) TaxID=252305 RepID=A3TVS8_PSEBH|nr:EF-hand domain-containing protein [Pseudooceanicola batsensis]EAQ03724.1 hypothetical protein OB2597_10791 [Pseudooceanicola batsensis HTCC2597]